MATDISKDIYRYLARDWGLMNDVLTLNKCSQLTLEIPQLRTAYHRNQVIGYHKPLTRRAYLAAFAARYAYVLRICLTAVRGVANRSFDLPLLVG